MTIDLPQSELAEYGFFGTDDFQMRLTDRLVRRIRAATHAREATAGIYLEHGQPLKGAQQVDPADR
jgi:hypothetical protein